MFTLDGTPTIETLRSSREREREKGSKSQLTIKPKAKVPTTETAIEKAESSTSPRCPTNMVETVLAPYIQSI